MKAKFPLILIGLVVVIQLIRPSKNSNSTFQVNNIFNRYQASPLVVNTIERACADCHSNNTNYPWYSQIQPIGWYLNMHVNDGKKHLNFDEFLSYTDKKQDHKLEEMIASQEEGWMPLSSYTLIHKEAILSTSEKQSLIAWFKQVKATINYHE